MNANNNVDENKFSKYMVWAVIISIILSFVFYSLKLFFPNFRGFDFSYDVSVGVFGASFSVWLAELIIFRKNKKEKEEKRKRWLYSLQTYLNVFVANLVDINNILRDEVKNDFDIETVAAAPVENAIALLSQISEKTSEVNDTNSEYVTKYVEIVKNKGFAKLTLVIPLLNKAAREFVDTHNDNHNFTPAEISTVIRIAKDNPFDSTSDNNADDRLILKNFSIYLDSIKKATNKIDELW